MAKWPLLFSRFYEIVGKSGVENLPKTALVVAVSGSGLFIVSAQEEQVLLEMSYMEVQKVALVS